MNDGVALTGAAHPRQAWYKRLWSWVRRPKLSPGSLETIEVEIREHTPTERLLNGIEDYARQQQNILNSVLGTRGFGDPYDLRSGRDMLQDYYNAKRRATMTDKEIEQETQAKGLTAPRITPADIEAVIAYEHYATGDRAFAETTCVLGPAYKAFERATWGSLLSCLTICVLVLKNSFTVTGESACASPENFNAEIGRKVARQKAIDKVWALEGYLLKERLHRDAIDRADDDAAFGDS